MAIIHAAAWLLLVLGGLNWGIIGITDTNLIHYLSGETTERVIYILMGLAAIYTISSIASLLPTNLNTKS